MSKEATAENISNYSKQFNDEFVFSENTENMGGSALGSWINLALMGKALQTNFNEKQILDLETTLGTSINAAFTYVQKLAEQEPKLVALAIAFWVKNSQASRVIYQNLLNTLNEVTKVNVNTHLPSQEEIDNWVKTESKELIQAFPASVNDPDLQAIIANIIATKITWQTPYKTVPATEDSYWNQSELLFENFSNCSVVNNSKIEPYLVHKKVSNYDEGLVSVYSIIGDKNTSLKDLYNSFIDNFDSLFNTDYALELANNNHKTDFLSFKKEKIVTMSSVPNFCYQVTLPAWSSENLHSIDKAGYEPIQQAFLKEDIDLKNFQAVVAKYNKKGYEAAALTYGMMTRSAAPSRIEKEITIAQVNFNHEYLVVSFYEPGVKEKESSWGKVPLFVNVVRKADEIEN
jgi:hypothetical protein